MVASYQFNRPLMNGQIGFLQVPISPFLSLSLSFSLAVCPPFSIILAPSSPFYISRCMRSFPPLTLSLSSVLSVVLFIIVSPPRSHSLSFVSYYITDSLPVPFTRFRVQLFVFLYIFARISLLRSLSVHLVYLCILRSLQYFHGSHISKCRILKLCAQLRVLGTHKYIGDADGAPG